MLLNYQSAGSRGNNQARAQRTETGHEAPDRTLLLTR
jgi:hypothetical protein